MRRPPPRSTLFPNTPLFRSRSCRPRSKLLANSVPWRLAVPAALEIPCPLEVLVDQPVREVRSPLEDLSLRLLLVDLEGLLLQRVLVDRCHRYHPPVRSDERRVGKERRSGCWPYH